ncbi:MAG: hypothetical protein ACFFD4_08730 [Candidatus Odinarchaeota archaeon]
MKTKIERTLGLFITLLIVFSLLSTFSTAFFSSENGNKLEHPKIGSETPLRSISTGPGDNLTIAAGSIVDGTTDKDNDGLYDSYYINVSISCAKEGNYLLIAGLNLPNPSITPTQPFEYIVGFDKNFDMTGGAYVLPGNTSDPSYPNYVVTIVFPGEILSTLLPASGNIEVINIVAFDLSDPSYNPSAGGLPPVDALVGNFPGSVSDTPVYTSTIQYSPSDFELLYLLVEQWQDENIDLDGDGVYDRLRLSAQVNASEDMQIVFNAVLDSEENDWTHNMTTVQKGLTWVDLYWESYQLPSDGPFNVKQCVLQMWDEEIDYWKMITVLQDAYTTTSAPGPWTSAHIENWDDEAVDVDGDGNYEYLHLRAQITATIDVYIELNVELNASSAYVSNYTLIDANTPTWVDLYWRGYELDDGGPFNVSVAEIHVYDETTDEWNQYYDETDVYTTTSPAVAWDMDEPAVIINPDSTTWSMRVEDSGDGGGIDFAVVTIPADFSAYGCYKFVAALTRDSYGELLPLTATNTSWFVKGDDIPVELWFDIRELVTVNDVQGSPFAIGNATTPEDNLTIWNVLHVSAAPEEGDLYPWQVEDSFTHGNVLLQEDIDPLPYPSYPTDWNENSPVETSKTILPNEEQVFWLNISSELSAFNLLNITMLIGDRILPPGVAQVHSDVTVQYYNLSTEVPFGYRYGPTIPNYGWLDPGSKMTYYTELDRTGTGIWLKVTCKFWYSWLQRVPLYTPVTIAISPVGDYDAPIGSIYSPETGDTLSDEFCIFVNASVSDAVVGVERVDFFLSGLSPTAPVASTDPGYWYGNYYQYDDPQNITYFGLSEDYDDFYFYLYPESNWAGESLVLTMKAQDFIGNYGACDSITIDIEDVAEPSDEELLNHGLQWMMAQQQPDGSYIWSREDQRGHDDPGIRVVSFTSWAMLAMLQNGSSYDDEFVIDCWEYISSQINSDGSIVADWMDGSATYETAIALMGLIPLSNIYKAYKEYNPFFSEPLIDGKPVYAGLEEAITGAVQWLINAQNIEQLGYDPSDPFYGGWGYSDVSGGDWSDLSNSQWAIIALAAARDYGIEIDTTTWLAAETFVRNCHSPSDYWNGTDWEYVYGFAYQPGDYPQSRMTAAGVWCLAIMGYNDTDPDVKDGLEWMARNWYQYNYSGFIGDGYKYYAILSAAKALMMTGHTSSPEYGWMFDSIYDFLAREVIQDPDNPGLWFWDNTAGSECPVYASLLAILTLEVKTGPVGESAFLSITASGKMTHLHLYDRENTHTGLNYYNGTVDETSRTTYSGPSSSPQQIVVEWPYKGYYVIYVYALEDGPINLTVTGRTKNDYPIKTSYKAFTGEKDHVYRCRMLVTTFYGVNIFLFPLDIINPITKTTIPVPPVDLNEQKSSTEDIDVTSLTVNSVDYLTNPGTASIIQGETMQVSVRFGSSSPPAGDVFVSLYTDIDLAVSERSHTIAPSSLPTTVTWTITVSSVAAAKVHSIWIIIYSEDEHPKSGLSSEFLYVYECPITVTGEVEPEYTLTITSPESGSEFGGMVLITWEATSDPVVSMTYKVEYSPEGSSTWTGIASGLTATQYSWDISSVDDGECTIRVTIEGTTKTAEVTFTIKKARFGPGFELIAVLGVLAVIACIKRRRY